MQVTMADRHDVHSKAACVVPLVVCAEQGCALYSAVSCCMLDNLSLDVVFGIDWLQSCKPVIEWCAYTVALPVQDKHVPQVVAGLPVGPVANVYCAACSSCAKQSKLVWSVLLCCYTHVLLSTPWGC